MARSEKASSPLVLLSMMMKLGAEVNFEKLSGLLEELEVASKLCRTLVLLAVTNDGRIKN